MQGASSTADAEHDPDVDAVASALGRRRPNVMHHVRTPAMVEHDLAQPMRVTCGLCGESESRIAHDLVGWHKEHVKTCAG